MVAGITLTSCGGGGSNNSGPAAFFAGKTYGFTVQGFGGMALQFDSFARGNMITAAVSFAKNKGAEADDTLDESCGNCQVMIEDFVTSEDGKVSCTINPTGISPDALTENCVLIFLGLTAQGGDQVDINSCAFSIEMDDLPTSTSNYTTGTLKVTQFDVDVDDEDEIVEDTPGDGTGTTTPDANPVDMNSIERKVYCYRIML